MEDELKEDLKKLIKATQTLSRLCAPIVFKHTSASGVSTEDMKSMQSTLNELNNKYC